MNKAIMPTLFKLILEWHEKEEKKTHYNNFKY